jgi:aspartate/methionine/tyrosine aminotransferase
MSEYRRPPALVAAELNLYASTYGASVRAMDKAIAETPAPADLIDLTHGDTRAFTPPASARADVEAAITDNTEAYSPYRGSAAVRSALAPRIAELLRRPVDAASELILTPGTQGGLFTSLTSLVAPGDVVVLPSTEYFMDERIGAFLGAKVHRLPVHLDDAGVMTVDPADLEEAARHGARGLVLSHPNNPTGGVYARESAERLATWAVAHDLWVVVDELYCRLVFEGREFVHLGALPGMAERSVTLVGPSKTESMSGYRVGAAVGPADVIESMEQVISLASLRTAGYAQHALRHWMDGDGDWLAERTRAHQAVRDVVVARLRAMPGVTVATPAGSSYVFPDASAAPWSKEHGSNNDFMLAVALKRHGALVSPGYQFGLAGRGHFRINFSQDLARLERALDVIERVLAGG